MVLCRGAKCEIFVGQVGTVMGRIILLVLFLLIVGALALVGYAYSGFMQPDVRTVTQPVDLNVD